ncbi:MAG: MoaD/ThiS family protein [Candidatus Polarisedimenticolia bacterium]
MKVTVLLFARFRELAGSSAVEVEVPEGATLASVWAAVVERAPRLKDQGAPLLARDRAYARPQDPVIGRQEIAAFPPVGGG